MIPAVNESTKRNTTGSSIIICMHIWKLPVPNGAGSCEPGVEVELTASHMADPNHLNPSCPTCCLSYAPRMGIDRAGAVEHLASTQTEVAVEIYTEPGRIVCSPADGSPAVRTQH